MPTAQAVSVVMSDICATIGAAKNHVLRILPESLRAPEIGIVCGSGLGPIGNALTNSVSIPYTDIPGFAKSTVAGHAGRLLFGFVGSRPVVCMLGRVHFYEGHPVHQVVHPTRLMVALGIKVLIVTNAAGGLNPEFRVGDVMIIEDHIGLPVLTGTAAPLIGPNDDSLGPRFLPMSDAYPEKLRALFVKAGKNAGMYSRLRQGVYMFVSGPTYETRAEARFLRALGADAVGMSTVPEVIIAAHAGVPCLGLSLITNSIVSNAARPIHELESTIDDDHQNPEPKSNGHSAPTNGAVVSHSEVLEAGQTYGRDVAKIILNFIELLA